MPNMKLPGALVVVIAIVLWLLTGIYIVGPDEQGIVLRYGAITRVTSSGLNYHIPYPFETVFTPKITEVKRVEIGFRTIDPGPPARYSDKPRESLMLTGDLNVAQVEWIVQYTIKDPVQYAFRIREPRETIRNMSEAVMRLIIGDHTINQILTSGRENIQRESQAKLQKLLDSYGSGVSIRNVILQDVTPPHEVKPSFNAVNEARQEKEKKINQAWEEYNRVIPRAKGRAEQMLRSAEGYALERINHSKGDADRFLLAWEAYKQAPEVTKRRLYLETMSLVLPELEDKLLLDDAQGNLLPLLKLNRDKGGAES